MSVSVLHDDLLAVDGRGVGRLLNLKRVLGVFLNEGDEALEGAITIVVDKVVRACGLEL